MSSRDSRLHQYSFGTMAYYPCQRDTMNPSTTARGGGSLLMPYFLLVLLGFGVLSLWMQSSVGGDGINFIQVFQDQHFSVASLTSQRYQQSPGKTETERAINSVDVRGELLAAAKLKEDEAREQHHEEDKPEEESHRLAGLDCSAHGGPSNDKAAEMVYWSDHPSDSAHVSPFYDCKKYMTFEPDRGGWNNIRMSMETAIALAVAMGRTLVLPPKQGMYLLNKDEHRKDVSHAMTV